VSAHYDTIAKVGDTVQYQFTPSPAHGVTVGLVAFICIGRKEKNDVFSEEWWGWCDREQRMVRVSVGYWWKVVQKQPKTGGTPK
jgi:hypothetical protein